jgi:hypothetical protein
MRFTCIALAVASVGFVLAAERDAHAQGIATPTQPRAEAAPATAAPAPAAASPADKDKVPAEPADEARLRIGFNVNGGVGSGGDLSGPALGATLRVGWQLNHLMAIYGQVSPYAWFGGTDKTTAGGAKIEVGAVSSVQVTPLFSLTPIDLLEVAAGPSLDRMGGGSVGASTTGASASAFSGFYPALHGRVALHLGGKPNSTTGRRTSFTIGADVHPTFAEGSVLTFYTVGLGADWY